MSDKNNLQEISPALKLAYRVKSRAAIKELQPHAKKGEYRDLAKNIIKKRQAGIAKSMGEEAVDMGSSYVNKKTPQEKFKAGLKKAGYDPDAGAKRLTDLLAKQKAERAEHEKKYGHLYGEEVDMSEAMDPEHPIAKEYQAMKKHDIKTLRNMIKGQQKIVDTSGYTSKDHAISAYLRHKHGDKKVAAAMGLSEDVDLEESAWGQDKMANLRAAHDRHMTKALAANKAGDDAAAKAHQSKMGMIKTQMAKLKQNEEVELEEGTFKYHMDKAIAADQKGDDKKKAYHLDNARSAKFAMKSTDYAKNRELLAKHKAMSEEVNLDESMNDHVEQSLADKDINAKVVGTKVHVHPDNAARARSIIKKLGTAHTVHATLKEANFEVGHAHNKTTRMTYSNVEAKNAKEAIAKSQGKENHTLSHVYNNDTDTFHHPETGRKMKSQFDEAWNIGKRNPQKGIKVGNKVRSYDFPGMHDDHYVEGHVVGETPSSYHLRVNKVVRAGKEVPVPAHMVHVEAPKGTGMFNQAYAVHKILDKQNQAAAKPDPATGAAKTFSGIRGR